MLEKLEDPEYAAIAKPCEHALDLVRQVAAQVPDPQIAEVGIGIGATSVELCRLLENGGHVSLFDYAERVDDLAADLTANGFKNFKTYGNSHRTFDSYCWTLARVLQKMRQSGGDGVYDFIYLDGCHMFHHDAPATMICKELIKPGGILLMDDYNWSIAISPTIRPSTHPNITKHFSEDQIETPHVAFICELFLDSDPAFETLDIGYLRGVHEHRRAYRRISGAS